MINENIGKAMYGVISNGVFAVRIISGIVTGVRYTEDKPIYDIEFGKDRWSTSVITDNDKDLIRLLNLPSLERVKETHGLKIKYEK